MLVVSECVKRSQDRITLVGCSFLNRTYTSCFFFFFLFPFPSLYCFYIVASFFFFFASVRVGERRCLGHVMSVKVIIL